VATRETQKLFDDSEGILEILMAMKKVVQFLVAMREFSPQKPVDIVVVPRTLEELAKVCGVCAFVTVQFLDLW
jgi:hypothetical protein